jgi:hypothetical protein
MPTQKIVENAVSSYYDNEFAKYMKLATGAKRVADKSKSAAHKEKSQELALRYTRMALSSLELAILSSK